MWVLYASASAVFAGIVSILAKVGVKQTDSTLATALRTTIVVLFAWLMVFVVGSWTSIPTIQTKSLIFLLLSGLATGGSWLCYFRALQLGDVNKVVPLDKSSTLLTMLMSFAFLGEAWTWAKLAAMALIALGTYLMLERKESSGDHSPGHKWLIYAILSAVFASLTSILGKIGIHDIESNLGTAIRTVVVLIMAWLIVFAKGKQRELKHIDRRSWLFLILSGLATGLSWLCFYRALQEGPASVVVPIDKLSILVTVAFGYFAFHEKLTRKSTLGLALIVSGTLSLCFW